MTSHYYMLYMKYMCIYISMSYNIEYYKIIDYICVCVYIVYMCKTCLGRIYTLCIYTSICMCIYAYTCHIYVCK